MFRKYLTKNGEVSQIWSPRFFLNEKCQKCHKTPFYFCTWSNVGKFTVKCRENLEKISSPKNCYYGKNKHSWPEYSPLIIYVYALSCVKFDCPIFLKVSYFIFQNLNSINVHFNILTSFAYRTSLIFAYFARTFTIFKYYC